MTDYFALLEQPRRPWLDSEKLKRSFHEKTLRAHPDAHLQAGSAGEAEAAFTQVNEAYQVLQDPKRRLHHLLSLEESPPQKSAAVPHDLEELFPAIAKLTQAADGLSRKLAAATNPLSRSLIQPELLGVQHRLGAAVDHLHLLESEATAQLQNVSETWSTGDVGAAAELHRLYLRFSYLPRWLEELHEKRAHLSAL